jgi:hypothetical protein
MMSFDRGIGLRFWRGPTASLKATIEGQDKDAVEVHVLL